MKQVVQSQRNSQLRVEDVPAPVVQPGGLLVRTAYSLISAGTERAKVEVAKKSLVGKALARPDQVKLVIETAQQIGIVETYHKVVTRLEALTALGYSLAGVVVGVGAQVNGFEVGDWVACGGEGANHAEVGFIPHNLCVKVPDGVGLDEAAYATLGAIALQGVRQAAPTLGETVGVIGLGLLGLLTVQLLRANGCRVVGIDVNRSRCELAQKIGADMALTPEEAAQETLVHRFSPTGLDAVILTAATQSSDPIVLAGRLSRDRGRVVVVGAVGMEVPRSPFYDKELDIRFSRSYGPGRYDSMYEEKGVDYPIGYVRWTEGRNMAAFLDLIAQRKVDVKTLTTHRFRLENAKQAYALIEGKTQEPYIGVLLDYGLSLEEKLEPPASNPIQVYSSASPPGRIGLALLGAGNFAQSMLLPHLRRYPHVRLRTVITPRGLTARSVAERVGFELCAADAETAFVDPEVRLVLIASRHDSHADLAIRALQAGKAVFVEKPLALSMDQLKQIVGAYQRAASRNSPRPFLMVGFNRRFAPLAIKLREFVAQMREPLLIHYRVNAGYIPREHWTQNPEEGGGRILGEACHFVDLLLHLVGHSPVEVYARALPDQGRYNRDNLTATIRFADGSVGTITYAANGDRGVEKERLEVFGGGRAAVLEDFRQLILAFGGRRTVKKSSPDKGHRAEMLKLVEAIREEAAEEPVPFMQSVLATKVTFAILDALTTGLPVQISQNE